MVLMACVPRVTERGQKLKAELQAGTFEPAHRDASAPALPPTTFGTTSL